MRKYLGHVRNLVILCLSAAALFTTFKSVASAIQAGPATEHVPLDPSAISRRTPAELRSDLERWRGEVLDSIARAPVPAELQPTSPSPATRGPAASSIAPSGFADYARDGQNAKLLWKRLLALAQEESARSASESVNWENPVRLDKVVLESVLAPFVGPQGLSGGLLQEFLEVRSFVARAGGDGQIFRVWPEELKGQEFCGTWAGGSNSLRSVLSGILTQVEASSNRADGKSRALTAYSSWLDRITPLLGPDPIEVQLADDARRLAAFTRFREHVSRTESLWSMRDALVAARLDGRRGPSLVESAHPDLRDLGVAVGSDWAPLGAAGGSRPVLISAAHVWLEYLLCLSIDQDFEKARANPIPLCDSAAPYQDGLHEDYSIEGFLQRNRSYCVTQSSGVREVQLRAVASPSNSWPFAVSGSDFEQSLSELNVAVRRALDTCSPIRESIHKDVAEVAVGVSLIQIQDSTFSAQVPSDSVEKSRLIAELAALRKQVEAFASTVRQRTSAAKLGSPFDPQGSSPNPAAGINDEQNQTGTLPRLTFAEAADELKRQAGLIRVLYATERKHQSLLRTYSIARLRIEEGRTRVEVAEQAIAIANQSERIAGLYVRMADQMAVVESLEVEAKKYLLDAASDTLASVQLRLDTGEELLQASLALAEQYRDAIREAQKNIDEASAAFERFRQDANKAIDEIREQNEEDDWWNIGKWFVRIVGIVLAPFTGGQSLQIALQVEQGLNLARQLIHSDWSNFGSIVKNVVSVVDYAKGVELFDVEKLPIADNLTAWRVQLQSYVPKDIKNIAETMRKEFAKLKPSEREAVMAIRQCIDLRLNVDLMNGKLEIRGTVNKDAHALIAALAQSDVFLSTSRDARTAINEFTGPIVSKISSLDKIAEQLGKLDAEKDLTKIKQLTSEAEKQFKELGVGLKKSPDVEQWLRHISDEPEIVAAERKARALSQQAQEQLGQAKERIMRPFDEAAKVAEGATTQVQTKLSAIKEQLGPALALLQVPALKGVVVKVDVALPNERFVVVGKGYSIAARSMEAAQAMVGTAIQQFQSEANRLTKEVTSAGDVAQKLAKDEKYDEARAAVSRAIAAGSDGFKAAIGQLRAKLASAEVEVAKAETDVKALQLQESSARNSQAAAQLGRLAQDQRIRVNKTLGEIRAKESDLARQLISQSTKLRNAAQLDLRAREIALADAYAACLSADVDPRDPARVFGRRTPFMVALGLASPDSTGQESSYDAKAASDARTGVGDWMRLCRPFVSSEDLPPPLLDGVTLQRLETIASSQVDLATRARAAERLTGLVDHAHKAMRDFVRLLDSAASATRRFKPQLNWVPLVAEVDRVNDVYQEAGFRSRAKDIVVPIQARCAGSCIVGVVEFEVCMATPAGSDRNLGLWRKATDLALFDLEQARVVVQGSQGERPEALADDLWFVIEAPQLDAAQIDKYQIGDLERVRREVAAAAIQVRTRANEDGNVSDRFLSELRSGVAANPSRRLYPAEGRWRIWLFARGACDEDDARRVVSTPVTVTIPTVGIRPKER